MIQNNLEAVEHTFKQCIQVAEKSKTRLRMDMDQTQNVFMWQNNLLKFYMENNIDKALDFSNELIDEIENILTPEDLGDLYFSNATSVALQGDTGQFPRAIKMFEHCLEGAPSEQNKGYIYNNLGMVKFYSFIDKSSKLQDPQGAGIDLMKPILEDFSMAVKNLKSSVRSFEQFESRFSELELDQAEMEKVPEDVRKQAEDGKEKIVNPQMLQSKMFADELFYVRGSDEVTDPKKILEILPEQFDKHYDVRNAAQTERILQNVFREP